MYEVRPTRAAHWKLRPRVFIRGCSHRYPYDSQILDSQKESWCSAQATLFGCLDKQFRHVKPLL